MALLLAKEKARGNLIGLRVWQDRSSIQPKNRSWTVIARGKLEKGR